MPNFVSKWFAKSRRSIRRNPPERIKEMHMEWSLYDSEGRRKHLSPREREKFLKAAFAARGETATFCAVLVYTGARISEVLALTPDRIDEEYNAINFLTLKGRIVRRTRSVPIPRDLILQLNAVHKFKSAKLHPDTARERLWTFSRTTGWRRVKTVMRMARIPAHLAHPHILRHTAATEAKNCGVQLDDIQR